MSIHPQIRIVVRPYGSAVPLGFFAFGIGMFLYAALDAPWIPATEAKTIGLMFVSFVGPLEALSTILAFLSRDTTSGVSLGLFTGSWFMAGFTMIQAKAGELSPAQGYFLIGFTVAVLLLAIVALLGQPLIAALLTVASARAVCTAIYQLGGDARWNHLGGWLGLVIFCVAMYGALAFLLEDARGHAVLPLGRRGTSAEAIDAGLEAQLADIADEPGVRKRL
jgi:succinate-acetate transporter protein